MDLKLVIFVISAVCLHAISAAPKPASPEYLLEKNLADYLRHDKEMLQELEEIGQLAENPHAANRFRRQAELDNSPDLEGEGVEDEQQPGFFDRAAKFIVDLLQRFLKWINTDSN